MNHLLAQRASCELNTEQRRLRSLLQANYSEALNGRTDAVSDFLPRVNILRWPLLRRRQRKTSLMVPMGAAWSGGGVPPASCSPCCVGAGCYTGGLIPRALGRHFISEGLRTWYECYTHSLTWGYQPTIRFEENGSCKELYL